MSDALRELIVAIDFKGIDLDKLTRMDSAINHIEGGIKKMGQDATRMAAETTQAGRKGADAMQTIDRATNAADKAVDTMARDVDRLGRKMDETGGKGSRFGSAMRSMGGATVGALGTGAALAGGALVGALGAVSVAAVAAGGLIMKTGIDFNAKMEQSQMSWETLLGNADDAKKMMGDLQTMGAKTPFEFAGLDKAAKTLTMAGWKGENLFNTMTAVGDAVSAVGGNDDTLQGVSTALFQMSAKGKVQAEEMMQLAERGLPVWDILAGKMGKSTEELMAMSQKGQLLSKDVLPLLVEGLGDKFGGSMEKQSKTFSGMMSTLKDNWKMLAGQLSAPVFDKLKQGLPVVIDLVSKFSDGFKTGGLQGGFANILPPEVMDAVTGAVKIIGGVVDWFKNLFVQHKDEILSAATGLWTMLMSGFDMLSSFWDTWGGTITSVIGQTFTTVWNIISGAFAVVSDIFNIFSNIFQGDWDGVWANVQNLFVDAWNLIIDAANGVGGILETIFGDVLSKIGNFFNGMWEDFKTWGGNLLQGLIDGFMEKKDAAVAKVKEIGQSIKDAVTGFFGIHSPSRLMMEMGGYIGEGMEIGISNKASDVVDAANNMSVGAASAAGSNISASGSASTTNNATFSPTINIYAGADGGSMSVEDIKRAVSEQLQTFWLQMGVKLG